MSGIVAVLPMLVLAVSVSGSAHGPPTPHQMATAAYGSGDFQSCALLYDQELGKEIWSVPLTEFNAARCYAKAGRIEDALLAVNRAIGHPAFSMPHVEELETEQAWEALRLRDDWPELLRSARRNAQLHNFLGSGLDIGHARSNPPRFPSFPSGDNRKRMVTLIVWVAEDGSPAQVEVEKSSGIRSFDRIAIETARRWRYTPAQSDGKKYGYPVRVPFVF